MTLKGYSQKFIQQMMASKMKYQRVNNEEMIDMPGEEGEPSGHWEAGKREYQKTQHGVLSGIGSVQVQSNTNL